MRGGPLIVYGDGSQTRSFCYISDMVTALMRLMSTPDQVTGPINLGNPEEVSVIEVAEKIIAATGSPSTIAFQALPRDDPTRRRPDISAARKLLERVRQRARQAAPPPRLVGRLGHGGAAVTSRQEGRWQGQTQRQ